MPKSRQDAAKNVPRPHFNQKITKEGLIIIKLLLLPFKQNGGCLNLSPTLTGLIAMDFRSKILINLFLVLRESNRTMELHIIVAREDQKILMDSKSLPWFYPRKWV